MLVICSIPCTNAGSPGFALTTNLDFFIFNSATKSTKILKNTYELYIINMKQLVSEFF